MRLPALLVMLSFSVWVHAEKVSIRADEWFPMNGKPGQALPGYMIELAERTFGDIDYKLMPWQRAIEEVRAGRNDCVIGGYREDTPSFIFPQESWGMERNGVYTMASSSWVYKGFESFLTIRVGVVKGYAYSPEFDVFARKHPEVFNVSTGQDAIIKLFKMLVTGRVDAIVVSVPVADYKMRQMEVSKRLTLAGYLNAYRPLYIACSPLRSHSYELVHKVDITIRELRDSGELEKIMNKYGMTDWKQASY